MEYKVLKDIAKITMGQSPDSASYNEVGDGLPFYQGNADFGEVYPNERIWCNAPKKTAASGDILISVRAPIGALNYAKDTCCIGRGLAAITIEDEAERNYVFHLLKARKSDLNNQGTGSTFKAIGKVVLEELKIPQISKEEQQKCMDMMDLLEAIIRGRRRQLVEFDNLIKARFVEMFDGTHDCKEYSYVPIKDFTDVVSGGTPDRQKSEYWQDGTIRWVKTTELQNTAILDTDEKITELGLKESSAKIVPIGTVLIAMYGQGKTRGMTGILCKECATNQACACILPSETILQKYLWYYMILSYDKLRDMAKGGNQPNLNVGIIKNFPVLMPPINMQKQFVTFAEQVNKSKAAVQKSLTETQMLFDSLMQQYFG